MFRPLGLVTAFLLLPISFNLVSEYLANRPQHSDIASFALEDGRDLHLDKSKLQNGHIHLFEASASGQKLLFLVQQTQDKVVHVALASCKACYHNRDFHYARKGQMMCGKCKEPMTFESATQQATSMWSDIVCRCSITACCNAIWLFMLACSVSMWVFIAASAAAILSMASFIRA